MKAFHAAAPIHGSFLTPLIGRFPRLAGTLAMLKRPPEMPVPRRPKIGLMMLRPVLTGVKRVCLVYLPYIFPLTYLTSTDNLYIS